MDTPSEPEATTDAPRRSSAVVALTFVVGVLLGVLGTAAVVATTGDDDGGSAPGADAPARTGASDHTDAGAGAGSSPDTVITVPGACAEAADDASRVLELVRTAVGAVRDFDPDVVDRTLNELETLDPQLQRETSECTAIRVAASGSATPSPVESSPVASDPASSGPASDPASSGPASPGAAPSSAVVSPTPGASG